MTKFTDLDLDGDIDEMSGEEAKQTLADFMDAHESNREAYDARISEIHEVETEYSEKIEKYEELVAEFTERRAKEAAEYVKMPAELLAKRFTYSELDQIIEEGQDAETEFSEEEEESERFTTFADRPAKGRQESTSGTHQFREEAKAALRMKGFPTGE